MEKYEDQCGSCDFFKDKRGNCDRPYDTRYDEKGYCEWYKRFLPPDDSCDHHRKRGYVPSWPCYITTVVCDILGFEDDCSALNNLRALRNDVLQKDEKYAPILYEYDIVGPQIASKLKEDYEKTQDSEFATLIFNFYIQRSALLYHEGRVEESIERYQEMTKSLAETYGIPTPNEVKEDYDYTKGGHGKVEIKKLGTYFDALNG